MTKEEAIKTLREDYCGNRIICELHPDQCRQEDCEIWLSIKALETQPDGDAVSRQDAIRIVDSIDTWQAGWRGDAIESLKALPSAQPEPCADTVSRTAAIEAQERIMSDHPLDGYEDELLLINALKALPSAQPEPTLAQIEEYCHKRCLSIVDNALLYKYAQSEIQPDITPDGTLTVSIDADVANVGRILLSQAGTQRGCLYYKDAEAVDKDTNVPCNDTISRSAAIDIANDLRDCISVDGYWAWTERLRRLPSAQPDLSSYSDKLWRNAYDRGKAESVRKGKWLHNPDDTAGEPYYICDQCGHGSYDITKFCSYCGSLNGEEGD